MSVGGRPPTNTGPVATARRARYAVLRRLLVPIARAKRACMSGRGFSLALASLGHDPATYPPALTAHKRGGDPLGRGLVKALRLRQSRRAP